MPIGNFGYSFQPGAQDIQTNGGGAVRRGGGASSPASAVEVRSLRLPSRENPRSLAPQTLLQGAGAAGAGFNPDFINLLSQAFSVPAAGVMVPPSRDGKNPNRRVASGGSGSAPALSGSMSAAPSLFDAAPSVSSHDGLEHLMRKFRSGYDPNDLPRTEAAMLTGGFLPAPGPQRTMQPTDSGVGGSGGAFGGLTRVIPGDHGAPHAPNLPGFYEVQFPDANAWP